MTKYSLHAVALATGIALAGTAWAGGPGRGARKMSELDGNKDGKVTLAELQAKKEAWFKQVDKNQDGVVTASELDAAHAARRAERAQRLLERRDANRDGRLTRDETKMPERWFARADANSDGALSAAELEQHGARGRHHRAGKSRGNPKLRHLDADRDGTLKVQEVRDAAARMLQRLDANSDGSLSREELAHRRRGKHHRGKKSGSEPQRQNESGTPPTRN